MKVNNIYVKVAEELNLPVDVVEKSYKVFWEYIRSHIQEHLFDKIKSEKEFNLYNISFNLPSLGKLYSSYKHINKINQKKKCLK